MMWAICPDLPAFIAEAARRQRVYADRRQEWAELVGRHEAPIPIVEPRGQLEEVPADG